MLISKTVCNAGSLVFIVPAGLLTTLHYDAHGTLAKVYIGFDTKVDAGEEFLQSIVKQGLVPRSIKLHGGVTEIWGVFYSNEITSASGTLPECEFDRIKLDIQAGNPKYKFYVGNVNSGVMQITPSSMQSWVKMVGFDTLPCWAVPINANDEVLSAYLTQNAYIHFEYPLISGFVIFEGATTGRYHPINLITGTVNAEPERFTDHSGYIKFMVPYGNDSSLVLDYPDAVRYNVQKGSQIVVDDDNVIWSSTATSDMKLPTRTVCTYCNKILDVPSAGAMTCSDPFCISRLYPRIQRFCKIANIEELTIDEFDKALADKEITILPDLLLLPKYSEMHIHRHLSEIVLAVIDSDVGISKDWIVKLCNKCNNAYPTLKYYLESPLRIETELDTKLPRKFLLWVSNSRNLVELDTIINSANIELIEGGRIVKFEGAPILRNKRILITGKFVHGKTEDIIAILNSYSAEVVTKFDKKIHCIVVGDLKEGIDGLAIHAARELELPIFTESQFFGRYQIDEDLEKFLN